jgi:hypothetical protein
VVYSMIGSARANTDGDIDGATVLAVSGSRPAR